jgi:hypothetical protein
MATTVSTSIARGEPLRLDFALIPPANIAGWTLVFTLAANRNMIDKLLTSSVFTVTDESTGVFNFLLPTEQTDREPRSYWWDVWRVDAGQERLLAIGYITITGVVRLPDEET